MRTRRRPLAIALALAAILGMGGSACGYRTAVRPPEDTAPVIPGTATVERDGDVAVVHWKRAEKSADGKKLYDLASFIVERQRDGDESWERIATVDVADQDKIRRRHDFSWRDTSAGSGVVRYRVIAVGEDGEEGPPTPPAAAP
ncbi:MAG TPA: hypothetical protein VN634_18960 [Candidatus Limnocylindrales bacterium]|nr:hypothetical protein [Candidatus Limnocylindrales bacterium]